jgi:glutamate--cysteine ligase
MQAPMIMIREGDDMAATSGLTFEEFMHRGHFGRFPSEEDWWHHLSLVFPDVRLRRTIESRSTDSLPAPLAVSLAAFWKGLLYEPDSVYAAVRLADDISPDWVMMIRSVAARHPRLFNSEKPKLREIAGALLAISALGLERLAAPSDDHSTTEVGLMTPLLELFEGKRSPAEVMKHLWLTDCNKDPRCLVQHAIERG